MCEYCVESCGCSRWVQEGTSRRPVLQCICELKFEVGSFGLYVHRRAGFIEIRRCEWLEVVVMLIV